MLKYFTYLVSQNVNSFGMALVTYSCGGGGCGSRLGSQFSKRVLRHVGALLSFLEFVLHLAVLRQVDGGNLLLQKRIMSSFNTLHSTVTQRAVLCVVSRYR